MPRRQLTEGQAAQIVALLREGFNQRYVARRLDVSQSTVNRAWNRFLDIRSFTRRSGQGRRRITNRRMDRRIVRTVLNNPAIAATRVVNEICQQNRVSDQTIRRRLHEAGLRSRNRVRVPALTLNHRRDRLEYAQTHVQWTVRQWRNVLFTDTIPSSINSRLTYIQTSCNITLIKSFTQQSNNLSCLPFCELSSWHFEKKINFR
ncbi:PREDICTED: uncharacterized protein LOC108781867 [Cyphomyrmex costatus]|uniref:uncharacterized protein LOC108781867 n=1 Tax=Cyphomyrmex costatus TaxID=456900 RepID=UPI00085226BF|nr:PREDICTED: uncharacterized protein LOC108781867 [Cyphomyrmex costatus]